MLTVDFDRFPIVPGDRVLDLGCGGGRHAFALLRKGADVIGWLPSRQGGQRHRRRTRDR